MYLNSYTRPTKSSTMKAIKNLTIASVVVALSSLVGSAAQAISVTQTNALNALSSAITAGNGGITITNISISGQPTQFGTFTNASGTYGIGSGIVISTGNVSDYSDSPNTLVDKTTDFGTTATAAQQAILFPITGFNELFDVAEITIDFDLNQGFDTIFFNTVFGSEEFPEFVNTTFIDGFGLIINGENIAKVGGIGVNINNPNFKAISGTELDGVLAPNNDPVVTFSKVLGDGKKGNTLTFIIADASDRILDSTAYFSALGGAVPPSSKPVPVPPAIAGIVFAGGWLVKRSADAKKKAKEISG